MILNVKVVDTQSLQKIQDSLIVKNVDLITFVIFAFKIIKKKMTSRLKKI